ncbi:MAG: hypothetical protein R3192_16575 [Woeseiaceae bacterium]|nr:hypothetical protein [Woeseiaceae bacterium]
MLTAGFPIALAVAWRYERVDGKIFKDEESSGRMWPSYSPNASKIAYVSLRSGEPRLWLANSGGSGSEVRGGNDFIFLRWSPTGETIVFSAVIRRDDELAG